MNRSLPHRLVLALLLAGAVPLLAPAAGAATPAAPDAGLHWHEELEPALAAAARSGRYVLVDLYAEWCGWCHKLDAEVFGTEPFARFARDYVLLRVDVEDGAGGSWLQERLGATTLPTLAVVDADLVRVGTVRGFYPTPQFIERVRSAVAGYETVLERDEKRLAAADPADLARLAEELRARQDGRRAARAYRRLLEQAGVSAPRRALYQLHLADALRLARDWQGAERALGAARATVAKLAAGDRRPLQDQADLVVVRLAHDRGGCTAVASLESFLREHPESRHRRLARGNLAQLRTTSPDCS
ncbi:MAG TPA: thioredoxin family protein [Thermoanaerobaculia bacterium]|nr:thioredoxin family protein [Thermoanaerobaculia bacterium]